MRAAPLQIDGLGFPEALRWHDDALWFSDMFRGRVVRWRPGLEPRVVLDHESGGPAVPGGLGWAPNGDLLVVDCGGRRLLRVAIPDPGLQNTPHISVHAELSGLMSHSANDLHVDSDGTAWVGGYGFDPSTEDPRGSHLVRVAPDGTAAVCGEALVFPNGCERAGDGSLVVAETFADRVSRIDRDGVRTTLATFAPGSGPDGLSIASDGTVFVALAFAGTVVALGSTGAQRAIHRSAPTANGATGCYDCAVSPDQRWLAVAAASADEDLAERIDTGTVRLLPL